MSNTEIANVAKGIFLPEGKKISVQSEPITPLSISKILGYQEMLEEGMRVSSPEAYLGGVQGVYEEYFTLLGNVKNLSTRGKQMLSRLIEFCERTKVSRPSNDGKLRFNALK